MNNVSYDNDMIIKIVNQYKRKKEKEKERYEIIKNDPDYKKKCCERSRQHYQENKEKRKEKYNEKKEYNNAKQLLSYYIKNDKIDIFKVKHSDKLDLVGHLIN